MPVEFALRPRISLERPPRRRRFRLRLPPLALPIAAYWLTVAGVTYGVIRGASGGIAGAAEPEASQESVEQGTVFEAPRPEPEPRERFEAAPAPEPAAPPAEPPAPLLAESEPEPPPAPQPREDAETLLARSAPPTRKEAPVRDPRPEPSPPREQERKPAPPPAAALQFPPLPREEPARAPAQERVALAPESSPAQTTPTSVGLPSCESAAEAARETIEIGRSRGAPDLSREAFASILENGAYLARCSIPDRTALEICAAVQDGKVVGVTVRAEPQSGAITSCVRRAVAGLRFPRNSRLDVTRTRFEAAR